MSNPQELQSQLKANPNTFYSGGPGTTGREPFDDSTAGGPAAHLREGENTGATGKSGPLGAGLGEHHSHHHSHEHGGRSDNTIAGLGSGGAPGVTGVGHPHQNESTLHSGSHRDGHHGSHDHSSHSGSHVGAVGQTGASAIDEKTAGSGTTGVSKASGLAAAGSGPNAAGTSTSDRNNIDRVGNQNQQGHLYETTDSSGPKTGGAAGTDRFDTDKPRRDVNTATEGYGLGPKGPDYSGNQGLRDEPRAADKSSGGVAGVLGTSDKDFTGRDRLPSGATGAYEDTAGHYKSNTSGPGGNTALTGREGDLSKNPVAQQGGNDSGTGATGLSSGAAGTGVAEGHQQHDDPHQKGFIEKVKDAIM